MSIETARRRFRRSERALMNTTGTLTRPGEASYVDGVYSDGSTTIATDLPALVRSNAWEGSDVQVGEGEVRLRTVRIKFPADTDVRADDTYTVTASTGDAALVDRNYRITDVLYDEWQISRTTIAQEVT